MNCPVFELEIHPPNCPNKEVRYTLRTNVDSYNFVNFEDMIQILRHDVEEVLKRDLTEEKLRLLSQWYQTCSKNAVSISHREQIKKEYNLLCAAIQEKKE